MPTYTDPTLFRRDVMPAGTDDQFPRLVDRAAVIAYNYINSYLAKTYSVPFAAPYPAEVVDISDMLVKCITRSLQNKRTPMLPKPGKVSRDADYNDCVLAREWLDDLANQKSTLVAVSSRTVADVTRAYPPIFDVDSSTQHQPSEQLLDNIDTERESGDT